MATSFMPGDIVKTMSTGHENAVRGEVVEVVRSDSGFTTVRKPNGVMYNQFTDRFDLTTDKFVESSSVNLTLDTVVDGRPISEHIKDLIDAAFISKIAAMNGSPLDSYTVPAGHVLVLRTSQVVPKNTLGISFLEMEAGRLSDPDHKVVSFHDPAFVWPENFGDVVTCDTYKPSKNCGNGLHGLKWGYGDHGFLARTENTVWQIVEVNEEDMVEIPSYGGESKVKFRTGRMIYTGDLAGASLVLEKHAPMLEENLKAVQSVTGLKRRMYNQDFTRPQPNGVYNDDDCVEVGMGPFSNLIGSRLKDSDLHAPALDMDVPTFLRPSSTPGHSHLFIDVQMPWKKYKKLLKVMAECGILEQGYVNASIRRGGSFLRLPWITKKTKDRSTY